MHDGQVKTFLSHRLFQIVRKRFCQRQRDARVRGREVPCRIGKEGEGGHRGDAELKALEHTATDGAGRFDRLGSARQQLLRVRQQALAALGEDRSGLNAVDVDAEGGRGAACGPSRSAS